MKVSVCVTHEGAKSNFLSLFKHPIQQKRLVSWNKPPQNVQVCVRWGNDVFPRNDAVLRMTHVYFL